MLHRALRCVLCVLLLLAFTCPLFAAADAGKFMYLLAQMTSKEEGKAEEAWTMLSTSLDPRAHAVLMAGLAHKDARIRGHCAYMLGYRKDPGAAAVLLPLLRDPDRIVRLDAVKALGELGDSGARAVVAGLLSDPNAGMRSASLRAFSNLEGDAIDALLQALADPSSTVRSTAIWQLGVLKEPRAATPLTAIARGTDVRERDLAIAVLGKNGPAAVESLLGLLPNVEVAVRKAVISALTGIDDPRAKEAVRAAMLDNDPGVRGTAIAFLAHSGDTEARTLILDAFNDRSSIARDQIVPMLEVYGGDPEYFERLISLIADPDYELDWGLSYQMRDWRDPRLVEPLLARLARPGYSLEIITALGKQRDPRAISALIALLSSTKTLTEDPNTGALVYQDEGEEDYLLFLEENMSPAANASQALIDIGTPGWMRY